MSHGTFLATFLRPGEETNDAFEVVKPIHASGKRFCCKQCVNILYKCGKF